MKKLILLLSIALTSCTESEYQKIGGEIIDGRVSATETQRAWKTDYCYIWVQTPKETKQIEIPEEYAKRWQVGDSITVIIEKYQVKKNGKINF